MFALNQIVIPGSADVSSAGWNCLSQRSEPAGPVLRSSTAEVGRQRSQEVEEWWRCRSAFVSASTFGTRNLKFRLMVLPYKVATLLYCFNEREEMLLLERA